MKIAFVCLALSTHAARWIRQLDGTGWELAVFDFTGRYLNEEMPPLKYFNVPVGSQRKTWRNLLPKIARRLRHSRLGARFLRPKFFDAARPGAFVRAMQRFQPDLIHVMELQHEGYRFIQELPRLKQPIGRNWLYSCWGSDLFWFSKLPEHRERVTDFIRQCPNLHTDCHRDLQVARELGFSGHYFGMYPGCGGFELAEMRALHAPGKPSGRRVIACKGYEHWVGRFSAVLEALERCVDELDGYRIAVYSATPDARKLIKQASAKLAAKIDLLPTVIPSSEIYSLFGRSRISIAASMSDGVPNSMLESMIMGAFPIQTNPGGATAEWIDDGQNGLLIDHDNVAGIAECLRQALRDDELVDRAAEANAERVNVLERDRIRREVIAGYQKMVEQGLTAAEQRP